MKITIIQTTTKTFTESYSLLTTRSVESYLIEPEEGKLLKHIPTGQLFSAGLCVNKKYKIQEYEEINKSEE